MRTLRSARWPRVAGAAILLAVVGTSATLPAAAASDVACDEAIAPVLITTVPEVPDAVLTVDGQPVALDARGAATVTSCRSSLVDGVMVDHEPVPWGDGARARYDRMFVTDGGSAVSLAFDVDYATDVEIVGVPADQLTGFTLRSSTGQRLTRTESGPLWLWGSRVIRGASGLQLREIYYTVDDVRALGTNVVNTSQIKFFPHQTPRLRVEALTYPVDLFASDRLLGTPVGSAAHLEAADGTVLDVPLTGGRGSVDALLRGTYLVTVDAAGMQTPRPVSVSQAQTVDLQVLTYLDLAVLLGVPLLLAVALVLAPRPAMRARLAFWRRAATSRGGRRTRTPDAASPPLDSSSTGFVS